jgi:iron complex transport system substrate-binding protein
LRTGSDRQPAARIINTVAGAASLSKVRGASIALAICLLRGLPLHAAAPAIIDDEGRALALERPAQRIVSLSPGATALLFAAGAGARIVGTASYSDEPAAARTIRRIGDAAGFDAEAIIALRPDVVVAWSGGTSAAQIEKLERLGLRVYRHRITRLDDLPASLRRLGALGGTEAAADAAAGTAAARIAALRGKYARSQRATLLVQVWDRPVYTIGGAQLMSDVVDACGYRNVFADLRDPGPAVSIEAVVVRDPAVIVALAPQDSQAREWLQGWRAIPTMSAVRNGRLIALSDARLSRLGPSIIDAAEELCARLAAR